MEKIIKTGCIGCFSILALMFVVMFLSFVFSGNGSGSEESQQPFEVLTKKGMVKLHLGMPKDSLIMIVGAPDDISSHSSYKTIIEELKYNVKDKGYTDLTFEFENGKLKDFQQY